MAKMIELHKTEGSTQRGGDHFADTDEPGENQPTEVVVPVTINPINIRAFYPRREQRPGTRITFSDGGGFVVKESYAEVRAALAAVEALVA